VSGAAERGDHVARAEHAARGECDGERAVCAAINRRGLVEERVLLEPVAAHRVGAKVPEEARAGHGEVLPQTRIEGRDGAAVAASAPLCARLGEQRLERQSNEFALCATCALRELAQCVLVAAPRDAAGRMRL
jgi:hypothetical protein